jgi:protein-S-isoprenylcysteine O-methyltransferase Ste14
VAENEKSTEPERRPKGTQAIVGAAVAIMGVLATAHPSSVLLKALSESVPELAVVLPTVITACGALVAALSEPPELWRRR